MLWATKTYKFVRKIVTKIPKNHCSNFYRVLLHPFKGIFKETLCYSSETSEEESFTLPTLVLHWSNLLLKSTKNVLHCWQRKKIIFYSAAEKSHYIKLRYDFFPDMRINNFLSCCPAFFALGPTIFFVFHRIISWHRQISESFHEGSKKRRGLPNPENLFHSLAFSLWLCNWLFPCTSKV